MYDLARPPMTQNPRQCKSTYPLQARMLQDQPRPSGYRLQRKVTRLPSSPQFHDRSRGSSTTSTSHGINRSIPNLDFDRKWNLCPGMGLKSFSMSHSASEAESVSACQTSSTRRASPILLRATSAALDAVLHALSSAHCIPRGVSSVNWGSPFVACSRHISFPSE